MTNVGEKVGFKTHELSGLNLVAGEELPYIDRVLGCRVRVRILWGGLDRFLDLTQQQASLCED